MTTEPIPPAPADRHGPAAATVLVGALLVLVGIGWLLDAGGVEVPWRAVLPAALIAVGLACVAGAFQGRQHAMMVVGVVLTVVLSVAAAADWDLEVPLAGGVGDRWRPSPSGRDRCQGPHRYRRRRSATGDSPVRWNTTSISSTLSASSACSRTSATSSA